MARFVFVTHKKKGERIADLFKFGAHLRHHDCRVIEGGGEIHKDEIGVFYGVVSETRRLYEECLARNKALYIDNGWLSTLEERTLRWAWNGVQANSSTLPPKPGRLGRFHWPKYQNRAEANGKPSALLCMQSPGYFEHMDLTFSFMQWRSHMIHLLRSLGYSVTVRLKPQTKDRQTSNILDQLKQHTIAVSLNSAISAVAITNGIPAFCTLPSTLSDACPRVIQKPKNLKYPTYALIAPVLARAAYADFTYAELQNGTMIDMVMALKPKDRKGFYYGHTYNSKRLRGSGARGLATQG